VLADSRAIMLTDADARLAFSQMVAALAITLLLEWRIVNHLQHTDFSVFLPAAAEVMEVATGVSRAKLLNILIQVHGSPTLRALMETRCEPPAFVVLTTARNECVFCGNPLGQALAPPNTDGPLVPATVTGPQVRLRICPRRCTRPECGLAHFNDRAERHSSGVAEVFAYPELKQLRYFVGTEKVAMRVKDIELALDIITGIGGGKSNLVGPSQQ
jgi:hypothetical protein